MCASKNGIRRCVTAHTVELQAKTQFKKIERQGFAHFPVSHSLPDLRCFEAACPQVCMAKTQYSFAADPKNAPVGGKPYCLLAVATHAEECA